MSLYFRQLLSGRDMATGDGVAVQMRNFAYAIGDDGAGEALLVDPAYAPEELLAVLGSEAMSLAGVVLTHYHPDHAGGSLAGHPIRGVAELLELAEVPVHVQRAELEWLERATGIGRGSFTVHDPGDTVRIGELEVQLLHTPGHTPGSQCLLVDGRLLTGDTLFLSGCGRTDLPGGDAEALGESLARLSRLPAQTEIYAGHAYDPAPSASLGELSRTNPFLSGDGSSRS